jgi:hypothetical protein
MAFKPSTEPVAYSTLIQSVLAALVATGWATIPNTTIDAIASGVGAVVALVTAIIARRSVQPLALIKTAVPEVINAVVPDAVVPNRTIAATERDLQGHAGDVEPPEVDTSV